MLEEIKVTYIFDSCYTIELGEFFLIINYSKGSLNIPEDKKIIFLATSKDKRYYTSEIFNLKSLKSVNYIINKDIADLKYEDNIIYIDKESLGVERLKILYKMENVDLIEDELDYIIEIDDKEIEIKTFDFGDDGIGIYLIIDSIGIFYGGNLNLNTASKEHMDLLIDDLLDELVDFAFIPIKPLDKDFFVDDFIRTIKPQIVFPTQIGNEEMLSTKFASMHKYENTTFRPIFKPNQRIDIDIN